VVIVNGSIMFTATSPVNNQAIPPATVATLAAGVIAELANLTINYVRITGVADVDNPATDLLGGAVDSPRSALLLVALVALFVFIVWQIV
jgi:hypothetical protein